MAYDSNREVVVLYGGVTSSLSIPRSTYEWNGRNWDRKTAVTKNPTRYDFGMAFDLNRNVTVLYGGFNVIAYGGDFDLRSYNEVTWEWDGTEWQGVDDGDTDPRAGCPLVYFPELQAVIRHGGGGTRYYSIFNDTWKCDGSEWIKIAEGPTRVAHRLVYDSNRKKVVLFGGLDRLGSAPSDTWEFDGTEWVQVSTEGPPGREHPGFAFDSSRGVAVLFGGGFSGAHGFSTSAPIDRTWEWDGEQWKQANIPGPGSTLYPDLVYDSRRKNIVLFRGYHSELDIAYNQTWVYGPGSSEIRFWWRIE